ncbi:MAG: hypothetical protein OM95_15960 [Bdellovibrio sp. ArHS]|uniref:hypothetical protein n=1 Tax=Bdellovibrio sp. ArHS TaxID=1569284 RepID=UPI0005827947|nr:hypothetical protein [Bdellovibrio sp. ArHS]KHD87188.1 MAG: hypothetical protein OM95_15960 [Bdellovibrio sp. ArHS]
MSINYRGFTNLAHKQESVAYYRPDEILFYEADETAEQTSGTVVGHLQLLLETAASNLSYPLNQRLEFGFRDIEILPDDWDTYGSPAPTSATIQLAKQVCATFSPQVQPEIMPERDGSISLHWEGPEISFILFIGPNENAYRFCAEITDESLSLPSTSIWEAASMIRSSIA